MRKRVVLYLTAMLALTACSKSSEVEVRWLESSQKLETIVFGDANGSASTRPGNAPATGGNTFFFQFRQMPQDASYSNPSGMYFYKIEGDSISFRNTDEKYYFKMAPNGNSFTVGRFFPANGTQLPDKLVFEKQ